VLDLSIKEEQYRRRFRLRMRNTRVRETEESAAKQLQHFNFSRRLADKNIDSFVLLVIATAELADNPRSKKKKELADMLIFACCSAVRKGHQMSNGAIRSLLASCDCCPFLCTDISIAEAIKAN